MNLNVIQFQKDRKELIYRELTLENGIGLLTAQRDSVPTLFGSCRNFSGGSEMLYRRCHRQGTKTRPWAFPHFQRRDSINMVNGDFLSSKTEDEY